MDIEIGSKTVVVEAPTNDDGKRIGPKYIMGANEDMLFQANSYVILENAAHNISALEWYGGWTIKKVKSNFKMQKKL